MDVVGMGTNDSVGCVHACSWLCVWVSRARDLNSNLGLWCVALWRRLCDRFANHVLQQCLSLKPGRMCHRAVQGWGNPCMCASGPSLTTQPRVNGQRLAQHVANSPARTQESRSHFVMPIREQSKILHPSHVPLTTTVCSSTLTLLPPPGMAC